MPLMGKAPMPQSIKKKEDIMRVSVPLFSFLPVERKFLCVPSRLSLAMLLCLVGHGSLSLCQTSFCGEDRKSRVINKRRECYPMQNFRFLLFPLPSRLLECPRGVGAGLSFFSSSSSSSPAPLHGADITLRRTCSSRHLGLRPS